MYLKFTKVQNMDHFSTNQAFNLLFINKEQPELLELTKEELKFLQLQVISEWEDITSPYFKLLLTQDKLEFISRCYRDESLFLLDAGI